MAPKPGSNCCQTFRRHRCSLFLRRRPNEFEHGGRTGGCQSLTADESPTDWQRISPLSLRRLHIFIYLRRAFVVPNSKKRKCAIARMTTPRTFAFSFATKALLYLCLGLLQGADVFCAAAPASRTFSVSNELPPRRGSHISTGFVKPALLVSTSASMAQSGVGRRREEGMSANASRRDDSRSGFGQKNERRGSYDLMNGMFDNECMQRHMMNTGRQEEQ